MSKALAAADEPAAEGISAEVIDLRTLRPLDDAAITASVAGTVTRLLQNPEQL
ncbi:transketolase C-terminal domain-containing protein [Streptomyces akebiae]|uniref:transketolase C-terminal domain-containing protein n=1 Tax=Streptomyces akebiae TaxID=2865673 RepID=UPI00295004DA|nr:transketolase C-terminal domain-containing protein [Streptomyces akebiae]